MLEELEYLLGGMIMRLKIETQKIPDKFITKEYKGIVIGRIENEILVEDKVIIDLNHYKPKNVELVTLKFDSDKKITFWKLDNMIFALAYDGGYEYITLPKNATFVDVYYTEDYPEGFYVKYKFSGKLGVFYISETQIVPVISHDQKLNLVSINFNDKDGVFYCKDDIDKNIIIDQSGNIIKTSIWEKFRKVKGYKIFFCDKKVFIDAKEYEIPLEKNYRICNISVIKPEPELLDTLKCPAKDCLIVIDSRSMVQDKIHIKYYYDEDMEFISTNL
jgi:hypothetical protein